MVENVTQALEEKSPTLLEKLVTNPDVCNVVLGLLGRCLIESTKKGVPFEGIAFSELQNHELENGDLEIRSKITFSSVVLSAPAAWPLQSDFAQYVRAKAYGLGLALQKNPGMCEFFQKLVECLEMYCRQKTIEFETLAIKQDRPNIITRDEMLVLNVGRKILNA